MVGRRLKRPLPAGRYDAPSVKMNIRISSEHMRYLDAYCDEHCAQHGKWIRFVVESHIKKTLIKPRKEL